MKTHDIDDSVDEETAGSPNWAYVLDRIGVTFVIKLLKIKFDS